MFGTVQKDCGLRGQEARQHAELGSRNGRDDQIANWEIVWSGEARE